MDNYASGMRCGCLKRLSVALEQRRFVNDPLQGQRRMDSDVSSMRVRPHSHCSGMFETIISKYCLRYSWITSGYKGNKANYYESLDAIFVQVVGRYTFLLVSVVLICQVSWS